MQGLVTPVQEGLVQVRLYTETWNILICYNEWVIGIRDFGGQRGQRGLTVLVPWVLYLLGTMDGGLIKKALFWGVYGGGR